MAADNCGSHDVVVPPELADGQLPLVFLSSREQRFSYFQTVLMFGLVECSWDRVVVALQSDKMFNGVSRRCLIGHGRTLLQAYRKTQFCGKLPDDMINGFPEKGKIDLHRTLGSISAMWTVFIRRHLQLNLELADSVDWKPASIFWTRSVC